MSKIQKHKLRIAYFGDKYNYNWEKIYEAIAKKEPVDKQELANFKIKDNCKTIIDDDYPNNFKGIYLCPFLSFYKGNKELLHEDKKIISIFNEPNLEKMNESKLDKENIYSFNVNKHNIKEINKLIENDYQLILVSNKCTDILKEIKLNDKVCLISEIDFDCKEPNLTFEQTENRIVLGISSKSLMIEKDLQILNNIHLLGKNNESNEIFVTNINDYD